MITYIRQTATLFGLALFGFLLFVGMFKVGLFNTIDIIFYRGSLLSVCAAVPAGLMAIFTSRREDGAPMVVPALALSLSVNLCFLVIFPVTVDRSISVYLLSTIEQHDRDGIDAPNLKAAFLQGYVYGMGAIDRRIAEQNQSGNITIDPAGRIRLTSQGKRFMRLGRVVGKTFGTDPRFLGSKGTDQIR